MIDTSVFQNKTAVYYTLGCKLNFSETSTIGKILKEAGIRATIDTRSEKIGYKIREAQLKKIPYMLVLGDKESESGTVAVRSRKDGDLGAVAVDEFVAKVVEENNTKAK